VCFATNRSDFASASVIESPNLIQRLRKNIAPLGCAKSLLRHLWVASFITFNVRNRIARILNRDSRRPLSVLAMAKEKKSGGLCDGAEAMRVQRGGQRACCELLRIALHVGFLRQQSRSGISY
jgi:hypothetical protein